MTTKPKRALSDEVSLLASAILQSNPHANQRGAERIVALRHGETQAEAQRRAADVSAKLA